MSQYFNAPERDPQIIGYIHDGSAYHRTCLPEGINPDGPETDAVFSWDEESSITLCDRDSCWQPLRQNAYESPNEEGA